VGISVWNKSKILSRNNIKIVSLNITLFFQEEEHFLKSKPIEEVLHKVNLNSEEQLSCPEKQQRKYLY